jgi:hypothetical protein
LAWCSERLGYGEDACGHEQRAGDDVRSRPERRRDSVAEEQPDDWHARLEQPERQRRPHAQLLVDAGDADRDRGGEVAQPEGRGDE